MAPFQTLYRHRELLWQLTARNVAIRFRGSLLGAAWTILNPLLLLGLYVFVFGYVFGGSFGVVSDETRWDYGLGLFIGLTVFQLIAEALSAAPFIVLGAPNFVKKVVFPVEILPAAAVGASAFYMLISLAMVLVGIAVVGRGLAWSTLLLPAILLPVLGVALGLTWLVAALGVFFRDIGQAVGPLTTGLMYASAIFYPTSQIPAAAWAVLKFNPIIHAVELSRDAALWHVAISLRHLVFLYAFGILFAVLGHACFVRLRPSFADVL